MLILASIIFEPNNLDVVTTSIAGIMFILGRAFGGEY
jgi:hypothetical protein